MYAPATRGIPAPSPGMGETATCHQHQLQATLARPKMSRSGSHGTPQLRTAVLMSVMAAA